MLHWTSSGEKQRVTGEILKKEPSHVKAMSQPPAKWAKQPHRFPCLKWHQLSFRSLLMPSSSRQRMRRAARGGVFVSVLHTLCYKWKTDDALNPGANSVLRLCGWISFSACTLTPSLKLLMPFSTPSSTLESPEEFLIAADRAPGSETPT